MSVMHDISLEIHRFLGQVPALHHFTLDWKYRLTRSNKTHKLISKATDIVIEGFPRSANTFAVQAFQLAQPHPVNLAHHLHNPIQVILGVAYHVPILVLVRQPEEAVLSLLIRRPALNPIQALQQYLFFYERILPYRDQVVIGTFEQVTGDFGGVIRRLNQRYQTSFTEFQHTETNVAHCFEEIENFNRRFFGSGQVAETHVARPSAVRERTKEALRDQLHKPSLQAIRRQCAALYQRFQEVS
jgi:hypothetical protein